MPLSVELCWLVKYEDYIYILDGVMEYRSYGVLDLSGILSVISFIFQYSSTPTLQYSYDITANTMHID